ncbi:MAG: hypothetical protein RLZZ69_2457, partial [Cyanobacteriota bacterium]
MRNVLEIPHSHFYLFIKADSYAVYTAANCLIFDSS